MCNDGDDNSQALPDLTQPRLALISGPRTATLRRLAVRGPLIKTNPGQILPRHSLILSRHSLILPRHSCGGGSHPFAWQTNDLLVVLSAYSQPKSQLYKATVPKELAGVLARAFRVTGRTQDVSKTQIMDVKMKEKCLQ